MVGAYLVDTITLRMDKGNDEWQEPNATEDVTVKVFIEYKERRVENEAGEALLSKAKVLMRPRTIITDGFASRADNTISYKDKIVYDGREHAILTISKLRDFSIRGLEVYVA